MTKPSFDMTVQALTGLMARQGEPGQPPIYLGMGSGDAIGGLMAALGIMLALHQRRRTGRGQEINASLYGAQLFMAAPTLQPYLTTGDERYARQQSRTAPANPLWNTYPAKDKWLYLCAPNSDEAWQRVASTFDDDGLAADARFARAAGRREHAPALVAALDARLAGRCAQEWIDRWRPLGIACAAINNLAELADDAQAWENGYLQTTYCEEVQREVTIRGLPVVLSKSPGSVRSLGPELGQHTEEILVETLGYSWDDVVALKEQGVIP
jgi:crotonobetainyl-CoA:carnitine CoA-transferase CaiB-like acyl-CoA transferase